MCAQAHSMARRLRLSLLVYKYNLKRDQVITILTERVLFLQDIQTMCRKLTKSRQSSLTEKVECKMMQEFNKVLGTHTRGFDWQPVVEALVTDEVRSWKTAENSWHEIYTSINVRTNYNTKKKNTCVGCTVL